MFFVAFGIKFSVTIILATDRPIIEQSTLLIISFTPRTLRNSHKNQKKHTLPSKAIWHILQKKVCFFHLSLWEKIILFSQQNREKASSLTKKEEKKSFKCEVFWLIRIVSFSRAEFQIDHPSRHFDSFSASLTLAISKKISYD